VYRSLKKFVRANAAIRIEATYRGFVGRKRATSMMAMLEQQKATAPVHYSGGYESAGYGYAETDAPGMPRDASRGQRQEENEIAGYLAGAMMRLRLEQERNGRDAAIERMSLSQKEAEKSFVKHELKKFDDMLTVSLGRAPRKADKEPMRPLYSRYHELKKAIAEEACTDSTNTRSVLQDHSNNGASIHSTDKVQQDFDSNSKYENAVMGTAALMEQYAAVKSQKRSLQQKLHQYESEFYKKHGRKMKHHEDIAPVQQEYTEYKRLKALVIQLEQQGCGR